MGMDYLDGIDHDFDDLEGNARPSNVPKWSWDGIDPEHEKLLKKSVKYWFFKLKRNGKGFESSARKNGFEITQDEVASLLYPIYKRSLERFDESRGIKFKTFLFGNCSNGMLDFQKKIIKRALTNSDEWSAKERARRRKLWFGKAGPILGKEGILKGWFQVKYMEIIFAIAGALLPGRRFSRTALMNLSEGNISFIDWIFGIKPKGYVKSKRLSEKSR